MKTNIFLVTIAIFLNILNLSAQPDSLKARDMFKPVKMIMAPVQFGSGVSDLDEHKVSAAMALAARLTKRYFLLPVELRDTAVIRLKEKNLDPTALNIAEELRAERLLFIKVNRLKNILRVDITNYHIDSIPIRFDGYGYAYLNYRKGSDTEVLYDPSLLLAIQRAFAVTEGDSNLYADSPGSFKVFPAKTLAIGGIYFENDDRQKSWELFQFKEIISFDMIETIFEQASKFPRLVIYDTDTRDSIYLIHNLSDPNNSEKPTLYEIQALQSFGIDYLITGSFIRNEKGADISLSLLDISKENIEVIKTGNNQVLEDDLDNLRLILRALVNELLTDFK